MTDEYTNEFLEWARTHLTDVSAVGLNILIDHINESHATIAQLTAQLAESRADAERLASAETEICSEGDEEYIYCVHSGSCGSHTYRRRDAEFIHAPNCPITLHRQLVAKYGGEVTE